MLYTSRTPNNTTLTPSAPFLARGLNLAPAKLGDIELFARPTSHQVAYSVYKDNIEAFLFATSVNKKVFLGTKCYQFSDLYIPTLPLPLPKTVFLLDGAKNLAPAAKVAIERAMEKMNGETKDLQGKVGNVYLIGSPKFSAVRKTLPPLAPKNVPYVVGYASIHATQAATTIYQAIEAFLSTQTYDYKGPKPMDMSSRHLIYTPIGSFYNTNRIENTDEGMPKKKARIEYTGTGKNKKEQIVMTSHDDMLEDEEDTIMAVPPEQAQFVTTECLTSTAKPSPYPANINFGLPSAVPNSDGILFPYFSGLIVPDIRKFREDVITLCFDCLPGSTDRHAAWKNFRSAIPSLVETEEGMALSHLLNGCTLALSSQARLFALFDGPAYLGYVLLGTHFFVVKDGTAHSPLEASLLREELSKITSITETIRGIIAQLGKLNIELGNQDPDSITFTQDIAVALSKIDEKTEDEEEQATIKELSRLMGNWVSTFQYVKVSPRSVIDTVKMLTNAGDQPVFEKRFDFFIPAKGWKAIGDSGYWFLARHGPSSFSFRNAKGDEYRLNPLTTAFDVKPRPKKGEAPKEDAQRYIFCYEKPTGVCWNDWKVVLDKGSIRQDGRERAAPHRAVVIRDPADVNAILDVFKQSIALFPEEEIREKDKIVSGTLEEGGSGVVLGEDGLVHVSFDF